MPLCPPPPNGSAFLSDETKFQQLTLLRIDLNVPNVSRPKLVPLNTKPGARREKERERERNTKRKMLLQWPVHSLMQLQRAPPRWNRIMNMQPRNALIMEKFPCCNKLEEKSALPGWACFKHVFTSKVPSIRQPAGKITGREPGLGPGHDANQAPGHIRQMS